MNGRYVGIDVGAETVKCVEAIGSGVRFEAGRQGIVDHRKDPAGAVTRLLADFDWSGVTGAAVTGRLGRLLRLPAVPVKQAQILGLSHLVPDGDPLTLVTISSRGATVLERRAGGRTAWRENGQCSQGTGRFLRQMAGRFGLTVAEADALCAGVPDPVSLSGRCPVILKTDLAHMANSGASRDRLLAGLFDAVCRQVQPLIRPHGAVKRLVLSGGVSRSARVRGWFTRFAAEHGMNLVVLGSDEAVLNEAWGAALAAARTPVSPPSLASLPARSRGSALETFSPLSLALAGVTRLERGPVPIDGSPRRLVLGIDVGSTGAKLAAVDADSLEPVFETYAETRGDPAGAAQELVGVFASAAPGCHLVVGFAVTGSGREVVAALLSGCFGRDHVLVRNEIAAHAEGARHYDAAVDTIFEIGGQDAKYIRIEDGRVADAALNEACSAGTGSFLEEQGRLFAGIDDVRQMGNQALRAEGGVFLGQHCSVFMAEVVDEAVAAGADQGAILAGLFDSVVQNYLVRVKGERPSGRRVLCQGMPFASDALAAAMARRSGSSIIIPPSPGTVGALGAALLAIRSLRLDATPEGLPVQRVHRAYLESKDAFPCPSSRGCGEPGRECRIERLTVSVDGEVRTALWGGACSLHHAGDGARKLPALAPDPCRERQRLVHDLVSWLGPPRGRPTVAMTDELLLKDLFPYFATLVHRLGFDLLTPLGCDRAALERGVEDLPSPVCAPLQLYAGAVAELLDRRPDYLLLPLLRDLPRAADEPFSTTCLLAQSSGEILRFHPLANRTHLLEPIIDMGVGNLESRIFARSSRRLARELGVGGRRWRAAHEEACAAQREFDSGRLAIGSRALEFARRQGGSAVVVLGRSYNIYSPVLNSNVFEILRELGAIAVGVDCLPVPDDVPPHPGVYWASCQRNLRAIEHVRRTPGLHAVYCSNYSCGPDSFIQHLYARAMEGHPAVVLESDGHSGDAGAKTRLAVFLDCVAADRNPGRQAAPAPELRSVMGRVSHATNARARGELLLVPHMGPATEIVVAAFRGAGLDAECLGVPDGKALAAGREHSTGKECLPFSITLGSALDRIRRDEPGRRYAIFMPASSGPCRFGMYSLLDKVVIDRLGLSDRVSVVSQPLHDFYKGLEPERRIRAWSGMVACEMLTAMLHHTRPVERRAGEAAALWERSVRVLAEQVGRRDVPGLAASLAAVNGNVFGFRSLLAEAAASFAGMIDGNRAPPTVCLTGEIFVRMDTFSNDNLIERLEARGLRVSLAPVYEFTEYMDWQTISKIREGRQPRTVGLLSARINAAVTSKVVDRLHEAIRGPLGWERRPRTKDLLAWAEPYLRRQVATEAVLSLGAIIHGQERGRIAGAIIVGPLECMAARVTETQLSRITERLAMPSLSLVYNGEPLDPEQLDNFAWEVLGSRT
jgi:activator of 2-hydroxyglutaryl-CoA dehydratase/predicted nucleotide-binding protein (sugar kinase/HSP70/actin superfamily)